MIGRMASFKQLVPFHHLRLVQAEFTEHGDPIVYGDLLIHRLFVFLCFSDMSGPLTKTTLKCEPIDGSIGDHRKIKTKQEENGGRGIWDDNPCFVMRKGRCLCLGAIPCSDAVRVLSSVIHPVL